MFQFRICALLGIGLLVGFAIGAENDTFLDDIADVVNHLPQYLEKAIRLNEFQYVEKSNSTSVKQCFVDYGHIFSGIVRRKMWAFRGMSKFLP